MVVFHAYSVLEDKVSSGTSVGALSFCLAYAALWEPGEVVSDTRDAVCEAGDLGPVSSNVFAVSTRRGNKESG